MLWDEHYRDDRAVRRWATFQSAVYSSGPRVRPPLDHARLIGLLDFPR